MTHKPPISIKNGMGIIDRYHPYFAEKLAEMGRDLNMPPALIGFSFTQGSKWSAGPLITYPRNRQILFHERVQSQIAHGERKIGFAGGGFGINRPLNLLLAEMRAFIDSDDFSACNEKAQAEILKEFGLLKQRHTIYIQRGFNPAILESMAVAAMVMAHMKTGIIVTIPETGASWDNIFKGGYGIANEGFAEPSGEEGFYAVSDGEISGIPMKVVVPVDQAGKQAINRGFHDWVAENPDHAGESLQWFDREDFQDRLEQGQVSLNPAEQAAVFNQYNILDGMVDWRDKNVVKTA